MDRPVVDVAPWVSGSRVLPILEWKRDELQDPAVMTAALGSVQRLTSADLGPIPLGFLRTALSSAETLVGLQVKFSGIPIMPLVSVPLSEAFRSNLREVFDSWLAHRLTGGDLAVITTHEHLLRAAAVAIHWAEGDPAVDDDTLPVWLSSAAVVLPRSLTIDRTALHRAGQLAGEHSALVAAGFSRSDSVALLSAMITGRWIAVLPFDDTKPLHPLTGVWQLENPPRVESDIKLLGDEFTLHSVTFEVSDSSRATVRFDQYSKSGGLRELPAGTWLTDALQIALLGTASFEATLDSGYQAGELTIHFDGFSPETVSSRITRG